MVNIKISKGLNIPIQGQPEGALKPLILGGQAYQAVPAQIALDLKAFEDIKFRLLVKPSDAVAIGQPLAEDKETPGRMFVSPASGTVKEVRRGLKRSLQAIVIDVGAKETHHEFEPLNPDTASKEELNQRLLEAGCFAQIRSRPFNLLADPNKTPRSLFIKAIESAPFTPSAEMQVAGYENEFAVGLKALAKLIDGPIHLIHRNNSNCKAFTEAKGVQRHTAEGPHPIANSSLHIQKIDPIHSPEDIVWTLTAYDVAAIGYLLTTGHCLIERVVSIAGPGILPDRTGYFKIRNGSPINILISGRIPRAELRLISGDPLMGKKVNAEDFMGFYDTVFTVIPENTEREFLHFMGLGHAKYSFSKAYVSGHLNNKIREYSFTTNQHGEHRPFIDSTLYDQVMPLQVPTMLLVKAVMAEDFDLAETLGLLEVDSEDFALPTFVCPSKMEMTEIVKTGLKQYAKEVLS
ncbi:MAG TPA: Na(+)-translocating NADH-quinone reductase subunit A [Parachlamydiaceae bacterium]|nr:Na(+)-translocating NADH-quinone reductase subunit A [Parachlamydiaceae bacterium]